MYQDRQLQALTKKLASIEPRLAGIRIWFEVAMMAYRVEFDFGHRSVTVAIPLLEMYRADAEGVVTNALHDAVDYLGEFDVIDVEFRVERKGLPGPTAL
jgi:hypothetical protein